MYNSNHNSLLLKGNLCDSIYNSPVIWFSYRSQYDNFRPYIILLQSANYIFTGYKILVVCDTGKIMLYHELIKTLQIMISNHISCCGYWYLVLHKADQATISNNSATYIQKTKLWHITLI